MRNKRKNEKTVWHYTYSSNIAASRSRGTGTAGYLEKPAASIGRLLDTAGFFSLEEK